jgi:hypothetical protein
MNEYESLAMWKLYTAPGEGVALRSTYRRLVDQLRASPNAIHVGKVQYVDFDRDNPDHSMPDAPFIIKRKSLAHENELRAVLAKPFPKKTIILAENNVPDERTIAVPVDLGCLIEQVRVAPQSDSWVVDLVQTVTQRFGLSVPVLPSEIDAEPAF